MTKNERRIIETFLGSALVFDHEEQARSIRMSVDHKAWEELKKLVRWEEEDVP